MKMINANRNVLPHAEVAKTPSNPGGNRGLKFAIFTFLAAGFAASISAQEINCVSSIGPEQNQTITILGSGFGTQNPYDGDSDYIYILDNTGVWEAGYMPAGNLVTLSVASWTDSKIVITGFSGEYGDWGYYNWTLQLGDQLTIAVWNPQTGTGPATFPVTVGATNSPCCQETNYVPYYQFNGAANAAVPLQFGPNQSLTSHSGCLLCCIASMLTQMAGYPIITPAVLDMDLENVPGGYSKYNDISCPLVPDAAAGVLPIQYVSSGLTPGVLFDDYLNQHFCQLGQFVILQLNEYTNGAGISPAYAGHHFVLVTGSTNSSFGSDWSVFDPGWGTATPSANLGTLQGHISGFTSKNLFRTFTVNGFRTFQIGASPGSFLSTAQSPIDLLVSDPDGQLIGFDPTSGTNLDEIPGADYVQEGPIAYADGVGPSVGDPSGVKTIYIPSPLSGEYQVIATGTTNGTYTLDLQTEGPGVLNRSVTYTGTASAGVQFTNNFTVLIPPQISLEPTNQMISIGASATLAVQATGSVPLTYQWQKNGTNLADGGNIMGSTTTNLVVSDVSVADAGDYSVVVSNAGGVINSVTTSLDVTLLQDGSFQTGDFSGWTTNGDYTYTYIDDGSESGILPYAGGYEAMLATTGAMDYLSQSVPTCAGTGYVLSFWLSHPEADPDVFQVSWNGNIILNETNIVADDWTNIQLFVSATGTNSTVQFGFEDDYYWIALTDISVLPINEVVAASITGASLNGSNLVFSGTNGVSGETYSLLANTNLLTPLNLWTPVMTNTLNGSGNFTLTATNSWNPAVPREFYILRRQ